MMGIGMPELVVIFLVLLLLFGAKKIPEVAKGLGKSLNSFKRGMKESEDELKKIKNDWDQDDQAAKGTTEEKKEPSKKV